MTQINKRDRFVTIAIGVIVTVLVCALGAGWVWWRQANPSIAAPAFTVIGPIVSSTEKYSVSARIALQTGGDNAEWVKKNNTVLRGILEAALQSLEPRQVHATDGLLAVQTQLLSAIEQQLNTDKIEQLLLTDFILQSDT